MSKITKKAATRIARLINHIEAAELMSNRPETSLTRHWHWLASAALGTVALAEEFGIELACLELSRDRLKELPESAIESARNVLPEAV